MKHRKIGNYPFDVGNTRCSVPATSKREAELKIAQAIYRAMKRNRSALIQGAPLRGEKTLIDGTFDLCRVAASVLKVIQSDDE